MNDEPLDADHDDADVCLVSVIDDVMELRNVAAQHPEICQELEVILQAHLAGAIEQKVARS